MKDFFKSEDFNFQWDDRFGNPQEMAAYQANNKLNKLRDESLVVYGFPNSQVWSSHHVPSGTHKAVITFIEELPKKECEHEPNVTHTEVVNALVSIMNGSQGPNLTGANCKHCGVELKATWGAK